VTKKKNLRLCLPGSTAVSTESFRYWVQVGGWLVREALVCLLFGELARIRGTEWDGLGDWVTLPVVPVGLGWWVM
jgi:hypothetical protein